MARQWRERKNAEAEAEIAEYGQVLTYQERSQHANDRLTEAIQAYEAHMRVRITAELLATTFSLGDGIEVTWGAATVDQHRQRVAMLTRTAAGTLETAAEAHGGNPGQRGCRRALPGRGAQVSWRAPLAGPMQRHSAAP